jgi:phosphoglycerate kinase
MASVRTLDDLKVKGKRVVVRLDLNVPLEGGAVRDATRIERAVPTLRELLAKGASVVVLSHFDRPKGKVVPSMSLAPIAPALAEAVGAPVAFIATDWRDGRAEAAAAAMRPGEVALMENTRFHPGEEANDEGFARVLAGLGHLYVNDAFSAAHRAHASTEGIARHLRSAAGRAMQAEIEALERALSHPMRPLVAVVGGAKISTKLDLIGNLSRIADEIVIGGAMANTFLAAKGLAVGRSLCEHELTDTARAIMAEAERSGRGLLLPVDVVVAGEFKAGAPHRSVDVRGVGPDDMVLDIGPRSITAVCETFAKARTLVWNGPFGAFELPPFDAGTVATAREAARLTRSGQLVSVAGGGDTVAALNHAGVTGDFTYVSTAGGAFLEWLEGKPLPGVEILRA